MSDVYNAIALATVFETVFSGISNASTFSVTYSAASRQFSVTTTAASKYTVGGIQYSPGAGTVTTVAHATTSQLYYLYYDIGGVLTLSSTYWNLLTVATVAAVYYNNSNNGGAAAGILKYELHAGNPYGMTNATHLNLHTTRGTQLVSGCVASGYTIGSGGASNVNWTTTAGVIADEDIIWNVASQALGGANTYRILWLTGTSGAPVWNWIDTAEDGIYHNGTNIYYNELNAGTWQLTPITANTRWVNYYIVATTAYNTPQIIVVMGQQLYTSLANAETGTFASDCSNFGLFSTEAVVLYRVTYRRVGADGAPGNAEISAFTQIIQNLIVSALAAATQAANVSVDTVSFTNFFTAADSNVQQALNDLDAGVPFSLTHGGTNASLTANNGGIFYSTASAGAILSGTATANQVLLSGASAAPAWSTATYPASTTINQLLYSSTTNTVSGLATATTAVLTTAAGVPTWAAELSLALGGTNANLTASAGGIVWSNSTQFQILAGTNAAGRLLLSGNAVTPSWSTTTYPSTNAINTLLYASAANTMSALATANSSVLTTNSSGVPTWSSSMTDGQVVIGATSGTPTPATILAGPGISITNGANSITINNINPGAATTPGRNRVINGDMQVWQRGAGGTASFSVPINTTMYTVDRWQINTTGNTLSVKQIAAPDDVAGTLAQIQRIAGNTSTSSIYFCTSLVFDMVIGAPGNTLTLSFKALCGANFSPTSNQITVNVFTGTGNTYKSGLLGAFTGNTVVINTIFSISTTLTQYTVTTASPIATTVSQLAVQFGWAPTGTAGANDFVSFTDVQLEVSPQASSYDRLNFPQTVLQCQRFYYKTFPYTIAPVTNYSTTYVASPNTASAGSLLAFFF